jgi:hypothetical protein
MLEDKAAKATDESKAELMRSIGELRQKKEVVKEKWNDMKKTRSAAWDTMKAGLEKAVSELKSALDKVASRFK